MFESIEQPQTTNSASGSGDWIAAIINTAYGFYNDAQNRKTAKRNVDATNAANKEQAELAWQRDLEMWYRNNEYNSPANQMSRLQAAGLNPHMVYGSGKAAGNTSGSMPSYKPAAQSFDYKPVQIPNAINAFQSFGMKQAQIDNVNAQTRAIDQRTLNDSLKNELIGLDIQGTSLGNETKKFDLGAKKELFPYNKEAASLENKKKSQEINAKIQLIRNLSMDEQLKILQQQYQKHNIDGAKIENEKKQAELLYMQNRNQWQSIGVTDKDNVMLRIIVRMLNNAGITGVNSIFGPQDGNNPKLREKAFSPIWK